MLLHQYHSRFPTEEACIEYFKEIRMRHGVACPECGTVTRKWLAGRKTFQCTKCGTPIPLTKGTVMEHSRLSLSSWFYAMHLMTSVKQVLSAKEVQHQLGLTQYPPVWLMMMKLRSIMGKREAIYDLSDEVELDEAFFPIRIPDDVKAEQPKRGAGSQRQAKVLVIVESKPIDKILLDFLSRGAEDSYEKIGKLSKKAGKMPIKKAVHYLKMFVLEDLSSQTVDKFVRKHVDKDTVVVTDGSSSHVNFAEYFAGHEAHVETGDVDSVVKSKLPWVHVVIGRCRNGIAAIHGEVDGQFLQLYLNEFCWKFNRRFFRDSTDPKYDLFDRLANIAALYTSDIKWRNYPQPDEEVF